LRLIHPMARSTVQRFGSTTKRCRSEQRFTLTAEPKCQDDS
jgi:hypothetical protein